MTTLLEKASSEISELTRPGQLKRPIALKVTNDITLTSDSASVQIEDGRVRLVIEAPMEPIPLLDLSSLSADPPVPVPAPPAAKAEASTSVSTSPRVLTPDGVKPEDVPRQGDVYMHRKTGVKYVITGTSVDTDNWIGSATVLRVEYRRVGERDIPYSRRLSEFVEKVTINGLEGPRFVRLDRDIR